jgi:hypothetical protein
MHGLPVMKFRLQNVFFFFAPVLALAQSERPFDASFEWIQSDDIRIQSLWSGVQVNAAESMRLSGRVEASLYAIDYQPNELVDPFGTFVAIDEEMISAQLGLERLRDRHQLGLTGSLYSGFRNPASIWIDRYYRQQYGQGGIPGVSYETPDPQGLGLTASYRYEVIPAAGFVTLSLGYLHDEVAPGYEIEDLGNAFELVRSEERLATWTGSVEWEGVVNGRSRTRQSIRLTDTTARELRTTWNGGINFLISDNWISRTEGSYAIEDPDFEGGSITQTLEWQYHPRWSLSMTLRYYEDTGQIEAANLISSAAPELVTKQLFLSLRYAAPDQVSGFSFSIGPYKTDYGPTGIGTERFVNLYQDRDWIWARLSGRLSF